MKKLIIDFDDTIVNSRKVVCEFYNLMYQFKDEFEPADWTKIRANGYKDQCKLFTDRIRLLEAFNSEFYFDNVKMFDGTYNVLKELQKKYFIQICTLGMDINIQRKKHWVDKNLSFIGSENLIGIVHNGEVVNKNSVDMCGAIFIDDKTRNLTSSNADRKICFGIEAEWNDDWVGERALNWNEIKNKLL